MSCLPAASICLQDVAIYDTVCSQPVTLPWLPGIDETSLIKFCWQCGQTAEFWLSGCRAAVHLKLRNLDAALKDAECAVELDPQYAKAYLRRASAHQALEHFEEAVKDFEKVLFAAVSIYPHEAMQHSGACMLASGSSWHAY